LPAAAFLGGLQDYEETAPRRQILDPAVGRAHSPGQARYYDASQAYRSNRARRLGNQSITGIHKAASPRELPSPAKMP
jgi:hypothetical protein